MSAYAAGKHSRLDILRFVQHQHMAQCNTAALLACWGVQALQPDGRLWSLIYELTVLCC